MDKVEQADAYIGLISYRYGQIVEDPKQNTDKLSLTELEFRRAVERDIPRLVFTMHGKHQIDADAVHAEPPETAGKLAAFKALARKGLICAEFMSAADLKAKVTQSLHELREVLDRKSPAAPSSAVPPPPAAAGIIPAPPTFHAKPPYIPGYAFQGRAKELSALRDWAGSADPVMLFEAIGGMGKSMVTWEWVTRHAGEDCPGWAGILWYSFYERGADMRDFCATALAYMTGRPRSELAARPTSELADNLLANLRGKRWLLVLDGLERVLVAYNRFDAAQLADAAADTSTGAIGEAPTKCIRPDDDDLLRQLAAAGPSKLLISSRLMPLALLNAFGQPVPGVRRSQLVGLDPRDAEQMLRDAGVNGDGERMRRDLERQFGCHPLVVGVVGGLVLKHLRATGNFDRWADDPDGGGAMNLADPDIRLRQNHILKLAFGGLPPPEHALLARIAMLTDAADWATLEALAPGMTRGRLNAALVDLEIRGLLQWDRLAGKVDLHPVVRGYAVASLSTRMRAEAGQLVADHFASRPPPVYDAVTNWQSLADAMQVVRALNLAGKTRQAWDVLRGDLHVALLRLERYHELLALLRPLFPGGWSAPPEGIDDLGLAANEAGGALYQVEHRQDAAVQAVFCIRETIKRGISADLAISLRNHSETVAQNREPARSDRLLALARDVAAAAGGAAQALWCDLVLVVRLTERGALPNARARWATIAALLPGVTPRERHLEAQALSTETLLLFREGALTEAFLDTAIARANMLGWASYERLLLRLGGEWHQAASRDAEAIAAFARAIELAHSAGLRDTDSEAGRGVSLARLGRHEEARTAAAAAEHDPPHVSLVELYLALGERDKASQHASAGYQRYWGDGPPYAAHWYLKTCRSVLQALGEPEPQLPPFDPAKVAPFEFEADIRRLLAEHAKKARAPRRRPYRRSRLLVE